MPKYLLKNERQLTRGIKRSLNNKNISSQKLKEKKFENIMKYYRMNWAEVQTEKILSIPDKKSSKEKD